jgi:hypothetical protein
MKKAILTILVIVSATLVIHAQGVGLGIKGGANFANQAIKDVNTKSITNFHVGAYLNLNFSESFGITPEVLYTAIGHKQDDIKVNTDYIAIPVMLRIMPVKVLSLEAGPQFSFLTKAKVEDGEDIKDQLKKNDFGVAFGAGLHLPMGFNLGARYIYGFTNISEATTEEFESNIKNRTFQVYVGWTFLGAQ